MASRLPAEVVTSRLLLRAPDVGDAETIFETYAQDLQVCRYMIWTPHANIAATREFVRGCVEAWREDTRRPYVITAHQANSAIGMLEARVLGTSLDIGYVLARSHWGKGYMPEAIRAVSSTVLALPGSYRVQATCDVDNIASRRALEKAGWQREGRLERYTVHPNLSPEPRACFMYACVDP